MLGTVGFNYYVGYSFPMSVTEGLSELNSKDAGDFYKIIYIKSGPNHFILNSKEFVVTGACAVCMNEQDKISFCDVKEETARIVWFQPTVINSKFTIEAINNSNRSESMTEFQDMFYLMQFIRNADTSIKILSLHTIDSSALEHKIQLLKELIEKQDSGTWPCRSRSYLFEILFTLARQEDDEKAIESMLFHEGSSRLAVDVIYYLQSCYNQKITIEKLSEIFHTNRTTLINDFKKYTGQSVNHYLIELRLTMASTLLRDTELSVDEICDRTGFSDISYFSKVFKKKLYYTPSEYRRMIK